MKVKIKKKGKTKQFKLISSWEEVTLEKWLKLIDFASETKTKEAEETIAALSTIPKQLIKQLELKDIAAIMSKLSEFQQQQNSSLKRIIEIDGKRYGFHPDLDSITLGEWADLETFIKQDIEKNLPEVMAILYRPITEETDSGVYTIAAYDGNITIRAEEMKKMSAEQVQSALVFFWHLGNVLLMTLPSFLMERLKEMKMQSQQNPSQKSGDISE
tara:strand:+ start:112 stop:756 length:645 start_codon:yes stop_codon:yes gene_type:complete